MIAMFRTLFNGAAAQAEERLESKYSIELIQQKIREASASVQNAKNVLVTLIQRQKVEQRQQADLQARIKTLTAQATKAIENDREDLASEAANTIAQMENEANVRAETLARLDARILRLRGSVEKMNRRLVDLRQGEIAARAIRKEHDAQRSLKSTIGSVDSFADAERLIGKVMTEEDPYVQAEIMEEIDADLNGQSIETRLHDAGMGSSGKTSAADVLARLKSKSKS